MLKPSQDTMQSPLHCLLYVSRPLATFSPAVLASILRASRVRNAADGITGMLSYHPHLVVQALEGGADDVNRAYQRIGRDPRHTDVKLLSSEPIPSRQFADWPMGYVALTPSIERAMQADGIDGIDAVLSIDAARAKRLLAALKPLAARVDLPDET